MSAETIAKMRLAQSRRKPMSAETRAKISATKKERGLVTRPGYQPVRKDMRSGKEEDFGPLRIILEDACREAGCSRDALTVLSSLRDPYRLDRPACHLEGQWVGAQVARFFTVIQRIHLRGLHYAIVAAGNVRKPDGNVYRNTNSDWMWLAHALKFARWLGYVPFDRITDQRNAAPKSFRAVYVAELLASGTMDVGASVSVVEVPDVFLTLPSPSLTGFTVRQPNAITIWSEKSSTEDVLLPLAERYEANLYLGAGETSDTLVYQMAKEGSEDGRPMIVVTVCDFDPAGHQMPISIGRKLQALRHLHFPNLRFKVVTAGLTVEQVRELGLPSTPLKASELRADKWKDAFGHEQTEVDALATLQPDMLREIVEQALEPYFDATLDSRVSDAAEEWREAAQEIIDEQVDQDDLDRITEARDIIEAELRAGIEALEEEADARAADLDQQLQAMVEDIELPEPILPEVELGEPIPHAVVISSKWSFAEASQALKARKGYLDDEGD